MKVSWWRDVGATSSAEGLRPLCSHRRRSALVVGFVAAEEMLRLPEEMVPVDALMDDPTFFVLFAAYFDLGFGHAPDRIWGNRRRLYPSRNSRVVTVNGVAHAIHDGPVWIDSVLYSSSISLSACRVPKPCRGL